MSGISFFLQNSLGMLFGNCLTMMLMQAAGNSALRNLFVKEATLLADSGHEKIVRLHGMIICDDIEGTSPLGIVTEFMPGGSLHVALR